MRKIRPVMSAARRTWLEHLRDNGPDKRGRGLCGYHCMRLGWTEWNTPGVANDWKERITEAGLAALEGKSGE